MDLNQVRFNIVKQAEKVLDFHRRDNGEGVLTEKLILFSLQLARMIVDFDETMTGRGFLPNVWRKGYRKKDDRENYWRRILK